MVRIATGGEDPLLKLFVIMSSRFVRELYYQCVKPIVTANGELSHRLADETIVRSQNDVMTLLRVGDGPDKAAQEH
jgi:hypothetical protein